MKNTVIYHSADFDGRFCREIARKFLPPDTEFIGWNFGDALIQQPEGITYILDLSPDCLVDMSMDFARVVWIDHHKTSIQKWPQMIPGYRIDGVAACRLAWQWFACQERRDTTPCCGYQSPTGMPYCVMWNPGNKVVQCHNCGAVALPEGTGRYYDRKVSEPTSVLLAGEYDIWDKRDPDAETFQYGLRAVDLTPERWQGLLNLGRNRGIPTILAAGHPAQRYAQNVDASICNNQTWLMEWEGLKWLCVNHARFNSLLFAAKDKPETGHDALLGFRWDGKCWMVSLYHAKHRTDLDLSEIAKRHGGGGHRGACGFTCKTLPFPL